MSEEKQVSHFKIRWDGKDTFGTQVASGIYIYEMRAGDFVMHKKLIFIQ